MEKTKRQKFWFEDFEVKKYRGINYNMYRTTPIGIEPKLFEFLDKVLSTCAYEKDKQINVTTEGSICVLIDVFFKRLITTRDIVPASDYIISKEGKLLRIRYIVKCDKGGN